MSVAAASPASPVSRPQLLDQLCRGVLALAESQAWQRWLRSSRRFHHYSFPNQVLILSQRPDATWVTGYRSWLKLGRQVRQGERGIRILAPCLVAAPVSAEAVQDPPPPSLRGFRVARVFDVSQTEGPELPQPVQLVGGGGADSQLGRLAARAVEIGFALEFTPLWGARNGDCSHALRRIRVSSHLPARHQAKTLAHELAHACLHGSDFRGSRALAELEAESVAFLVCAELGIDSSAYSFGYVATWSGGGAQASQLISATGGRVLAGAAAVLGSAHLA